MSHPFPVYAFYPNDNLETRTVQTYAADLEALVHSAVGFGNTLNEEQASKPLHPGKWSVKQIIGHLCDSAENNLQRIVRLATEDNLVFPPYEQEAWVQVQYYDLRRLCDILELFRALQLHLSHTIRCLDPLCLENRWLDGETAKSLRHLIEDYLGHLKHHLDRLLHSWTRELRDSIREEMAP